jgi:hypothetical protein
VDPIAPDYPWYTPYQFAGNTPIQAVDLDGLEPATPIVIKQKPVIEVTYEDDPGAWFKKADGWEVNNQFGYAFLKNTGYYLWDYLGLRSFERFVKNRQNSEKNNFKDVAFDFFELTIATADIRGFHFKGYHQGSAVYHPSNRILSRTDVLDFIKKTEYYKEGNFWSKDFYRFNFQKHTGKIGDGFDVHHTLPKADEFASFFNQHGIDVNDPKNLVWREMNSHRGNNSTTHTNLWRDFIEKNRNNKNLKTEDIYKQRDVIEKKVWGNSTGDTPLN